MIEYLKIKWYKCFENFEIEFNNWINLLVWENDAWKSSLLSVIRILKWEHFIDKDDFRDKNIVIDFEIKINRNIYKYSQNYNWDINISQLLNISELKNSFENDLLLDEEINLLIKKLWWDLRGNKKSKLKWLLDWIIEDIYEVKNINRTILFNELQNIQYEDWKQFSDIQQNFKNFIKSDVNEIWSEKIKIEENWEIKDKKLSDLVANKLREIKKRKEEEYKDDLLPTIKEIIPSIKWMNIDLSPNLWNFSSYESKVNFYENWKPVNIDKRWDWTKRRMTIALFKQESLKWESDVKNLYLFDEPDTHLNLRVQQDLINTFYKLVEDWHQIIFTSHSPFILNLINITNIVLLKNNWEKTDKFYLKTDEADDFNEALYNLWIQNIDIFFSKFFLFYEWETELNFFSKAYYKKYWDFIEKKFIRQVNCEWIDNEAIFMKNFSSIIWKDVKIISVVDKDYEEKAKTKNIIDNINQNFDDIKLITLWSDKEFEDEFSCNDLFNCFKEELNSNSINSVQDLETLKQTIPKFSWILSSKVRLWKPEIWSRLADFFDFDDLPKNLKDTLTHIKSL